jgi:hypothetical protein
MGSERRLVEREPVTHRRRRKSLAGGLGLGVDAHGDPVIDPTENVRELFEAGSTRQDDLRLAERRLQEEKILRVEIEMRALRREVEVRADHQHQIDALESKRLDAVRTVDQLAAKTEADRASSAVTALANAATITAETLRSAVNTSAANLATQLDRTVTAITERIAALEKSSYTGAGKQAVADPMMEQLITEMRSMTAQRASGEGKSQGMDATWKFLIGIVGLLVALNSLGVFTRTATPSAAAPQVIYVPAPAGALLPTSPPQAVPR